MRVDAAILGAGPSGSVAARLLASWGHRVVLVHRPVNAMLAESMPPSCRSLFAACGVADAIDAAGFYRSTGNTVWWGSDEPRCERFAHGAAGYQVERDVFADLLRREAVAAGAELREGLVRGVALVHEGAAVAIERSGCSGSSGGSCSEGSVQARFVLDCSGRAGVIARGWRTDVAAHPRTVALTAIWTSTDAWPGVDPTHTIVESHDDGWAWSVPVSAHRRYVTVMVDPQRTNLARGLPAAEVYGTELRKARHLSALTTDSRLDAGPSGFDASVYSAHTFASDPLLLVGDAASFVDPLSSYGIKKALASAWLAAVAVHTALRTPAMTATALAFHAAREEAMAASLLRQSRVQFEDAASTHAHVFWTDRATDFDLPTATEPDTRALRDDDRVRRAFAWLKGQDALALRAGAAMRREPYAVVRGHEIVMEERLVAAECAAGLRFLRDVDLVGVLELAPAHDQVPALFSSYNRRFPPVALPDFLGALAVMVAFGFLEDSRG